jgi:hypothetical protein
MKTKKSMFLKDDLSFGYMQVALIEWELKN